MGSFSKPTLKIRLLRSLITFLLGTLIALEGLISKSCPQWRKGLHGFTLLTINPRCSNRTRSLTQRSHIANLYSRANRAHSKLFRSSSCHISRMKTSPSANWLEVFTLFPSVVYLNKFILHLLKISALSSLTKLTCSATSRRMKTSRPVIMCLRRLCHWCLFKSGHIMARVWQLIRF